MSRHIEGLLCGSCSHREVCVLRPQLEAAIATVTTPDPFDEAISIEVTVDASCRHFLAERSGPGSPASYAIPYAFVEQDGPALEAGGIFGAIVRTATVAAEDASEPAPDHAFSIPDTAPPPIVDGHQAIIVRAQERDADAARRVAARVRGEARPLVSPMEICDPGCGEKFIAGLDFNSHRRSCDAYRAYVFAHGRQLPSVETAPLPDAAAARDRDTRTHEDRARAKAAANRASGVTAPSATARHDTATITPRQAQILAALRASGGRVKQAARDLGMESSGGVSGMIFQLRASGRLPGDVEELLTARRNERLGSKAEVL